MNRILLLVVQIGNQLSDSTDLPLLTHKWEIVVQVVLIVGVRHIHLQEVTLSSFFSQLADVVFELIWVLDPFKPASGEISNHHPTIQVIHIQVLKVTTLFPRIKHITHVLVVCLHVLINCLSDATSSTLLEQQQHIEVDYEFQFDLGLLKTGLTSQSRRGVEVSGIESVVF